MELGPVQILVVGFGDDDRLGEILPVLRQLRQRGAVRLLDLIFVTKDVDGLVSRMDTDSFSAREAAELGSVAGALIGLNGAGPASAWPGVDTAFLGGGRTWVVTDAIPPGTSAAVALIEHRWAVPLRDAVTRAGGFALEDTWVHPADLLAAGRALAEESRSRPRQVPPATAASVHAASA
jgi:hypothetical protein